MSRDLFNVAAGDRILNDGTLECRVQPQGRWITLELESESIAIGLTTARALREWLDAVIPKDKPT